MAYSDKHNFFGINIVAVFRSKLLNIMNFFWFQFLLLWSVSPKNASQIEDMFDLESFFHHDFLLILPENTDTGHHDKGSRDPSSFNQLSKLYVSTSNQSTESEEGNGSLTVTSTANWWNISSFLKFELDDNQTLAVVLFPKLVSQMLNVVQAIVPISNPSNVYFVVLPEIQNENYTHESFEKLLHTAATLCDWGKDIYIVKKWENATTNVKSETTLFSKYQVIELYSFQTGYHSNSTEHSVTFSENIALPKKRIVYEDLMKKSARRVDLKGSTLRATAVLGAEYRTNHTIQNGVLEFTGGMDVEFLRYISDSYNLHVQAVDGYRYTTKEPRVGRANNDSGQQIETNYADLAISPHEINPYRAERFTFLMSSYYITLLGFFRQPEASTIRDIFIQAFKTDLWMAMFSTWILIVLGISSMAWVKKRMADLQENEETIFSEALLWATGAMCQQGWHVYPESTSMKIIFISGLFTGLVSYVAYSAALVSILSLEVIPIRTLPDVKASRFMFYGDNWTLNAADVLEEIKRDTPALVNIDRSLMSSLDGIYTILRGGAIFLGVADAVYPEMKKTYNNPEICINIASIPINRRPVRAAMFVRKSSPLKQYFNTKILWMFNNGMRYRLIMNYLRNTSITCLSKSENQKQPLGMNDVFTAFAVLLIGYATSLAIFIVEKMFPPKIVENPMMLVKANFFKDVLVADHYHY